MPAKRKAPKREPQGEDSSVVAQDSDQLETPAKRHKLDDAKSVTNGVESRESDTSAVESTPVAAAAAAAAESEPKAKKAAAPRGRKKAAASGGTIGRRAGAAAAGLLAPVDPGLEPHLREINWRDLDFIGAESPEAAASLKHEPWQFETMNEVLTTGELSTVNGLQIWMYPEPHQPDVSDGKVIDVPVIYAVDCAVRTTEITKANIQGAINVIEEMGPHTFYWDAYFNSRYLSEYKGTPPHVALKAGRSARHAKDSEKDKYQRQFYMPFIRLPQLQETYEQLVAKHTNVTAEVPIDRWLVKKTLPAGFAAKDVPKMAAGILEQALRDNTRLASPKDADKLKRELRKALLDHVAAHEKKAGGDGKEGEEKESSSSSEFRFESQYTKIVEVPYEKGIHYTSEIAEELKDDEGWLSDKAKDIVKDAVHQEFEKLRASLRKQVDDAERFFGTLSPEQLQALRDIRVYKFYPEHPDLDVAKLGFINDVVNRFYGKAYKVFAPKQSQTAADSSSSTAASSTPAASASSSSAAAAAPSSSTSSSSASASSSGGFVPPTGSGFVPPSASGGFVPPSTTGATGGFFFGGAPSSSSASAPALVSTGFTMPSSASSAGGGAGGFVFGVTDAATRAQAQQAAAGSWTCAACEKVNPPNAKSCSDCFCNKP